MENTNELIRGYTEIILCAYLQEHPYSLSDIVAKIKEDGKGLIAISYPSCYLVLQKMEEKGLVVSHPEKEKDNSSTTYELTEAGKKYYNESKEEYLLSLDILKSMGDKKYEG